MAHDGEQEWLRQRVSRLRTLLRMIRDQRAQQALEELAREAEDRLAELQNRRD